MAINTQNITCFLAEMGQNMPIFRGFTIPGSREIFPGKREAKIHQFPGNSRPGKSREQALEGHRAYIEKGKTSYKKKYTMRITVCCML